MVNLQQLTIFGGSGFVGRHTVRHLAPLGSIIRIPTRDLEKALPLKPAGNVGQIVPIGCNVRSDASVANAIGRSDTVINLLGILFERGRNTFQAIHVEAAARIARIAKEQGARHFIQMSALSADPGSLSAYGRSKAAGEQAVRAFFPEATILRPSIIFGPEDNFFNFFAAMAKYVPFLPLINGGASLFQPVYVGDVAAAIAAILQEREAEGRIYDLGGPKVYSFRNLLEVMMQETRRHRSFLNMSWSLAKTHALLQELLPLPRPLLTRDQVELLKTDNVVRDPQNKKLHDLGIAPTALELILPTYLDRFRAGGKLKAAA